MKKLLIFLTLFIVVLLPIRSSAQEEQSTTNSIFFGYYYAPSFVTGVTFRSGPPVGEGMEHSHGGYIGLETFVHKYIALINTFYFGYASYTPDNPHERLRNARLTILYDIYRVESIGFTFNYDFAMRVFLGCPYVYLDVGLGLGTKHTEYSHLERQITNHGSPHIFAVDKVDFSFEASLFTTLGVSIPIIFNKFYLDILGLLRFDVYNSKYEKMKEKNNVYPEVLVGFKVVL